MGLLIRNYFKVGVNFYHYEKKKSEQHKTHIYSKHSISSAVILLFEHFVSKLIRMKIEFNKKKQKKKWQERNNKSR